MGTLRNYFRLPSSASDVPTDDERSSRSDHSELNEVRKKHQSITTHWTDTEQPVSGSESSKYKEKHYGAGKMRSSWISTVLMRALPEDIHAVE